MSVLVVLINPLKRKGVVLDVAILVSAVDEVVARCVARSSTNSNNSVHVAILFERRDPLSLPPRVCFNIVDVDEVLIIHADRYVDIRISYAESVLRLVSSPVETNACVGLLNVVVEISGGVCAVPRRRAERVVREGRRESRGDRSCGVEDALLHLFGLTRRRRANDAVHRIHEIR